MSVRIGTFKEPCPQPYTRGSFYDELLKRTAGKKGGIDPHGDAIVLVTVLEKRGDKGAGKKARKAPKK